MKKWWHCDTEKLERVSYFVTIVGFPLLVISTFVVLYQIIEVRRIASSQNNIALNAAFFNETNNGIINAIENKRPILKEHKGKYTATQLDNYLGYFETIDQAYSEELLTEAELCTSFSYYVIATSKNKEVREYMEKNPSFFGGFPDLTSTIAKSKNSDCHDGTE